MSISPGLTIVDITHDIPPGDVLAGAFLLRNAAPEFPPGSIHLAVVDPGVGSGAAGHRRGKQGIPVGGARQRVAQLCPRGSGSSDPRNHRPLPEGSADERDIPRPGPFRSLCRPAWLQGFPFAEAGPRLTGARGSFRGAARRRERTHRRAGDPRRSLRQRRHQHCRRSSRFPLPEPRRPAAA